MIVPGEAKTIINNAQEDARGPKKNSEKEAEPNANNT
jgi:F0F1-type ATP synthase membrane subunit b/b'